MAEKEDDRKRALRDDAWHRAEHCAEQLSRLPDDTPDAEIDAQIDAIAKSFDDLQRMLVLESSARDHYPLKEFYIKVRCTRLSCRTTAKHDLHINGFLVSSPVLPTAHTK